MGTTAYRNQRVGADVMMSVPVLRESLPDGFYAEMGDGPGWGYCATWPLPRYWRFTRPRPVYAWYTRR